MLVSDEQPKRVSNTSKMFYIENILLFGINVRNLHVLTERTFF